MTQTVQGVEVEEPGEYLKRIECTKQEMRQDSTQPVGMLEKRPPTAPSDMGLPATTLACWVRRDITDCAMLAYA